MPAHAAPLTPAASPVDPASLSVEELARLLSAAGGRKITPEQVRADIEAGAPLGRDGTMNLLHYTAWLLSAMAGR